MNNPNNLQRNIKRPTNHQINKKAVKKKSVEAKLGALLIFLISLAVLTVIAIICVGCSHNYRSPSTPSADITVDYGDDDLSKMSMDTFLIDGVIYINFSEFAIKCNLIATGTSTTQTFSFQNGSNVEYITFTDNSKSAVINDVTVQMQNNAVLRGDDIWVSAQFVSSAVNGIKVEYNSENKILYIKRIELNASTPSNRIYEDISFTHNITEPMDTITNNGIGSGETIPPDSSGSDTATPIEQLGFKLDLSSYEQYMNPINKDDYLLLVNKNNMITSDYVPKDLTLVYGVASTNAKYKMIYVAAMAFEAMVKEAAKNGYSVVAKSGYRSYATQASLVENYTKQYMQEGLTYEQAYAKTLTDTALPGASEHQTGLTMDVNSITESFGNTATGKWLAQNSWKFGFILRYPKDKEDITGIVYEPWHFRYVGRYHAEQMYNLGMCLEEYTEYLKNN